MIEPNKRKVIYQLHLEGMGIRKIARQLKVSRNTVRDIISNEGESPQAPRTDKIEIDIEVLQRVYNKCNGWRERMHEILEEEEGIKIGYSTLTRILRESGMESKSKPRTIHVPDQRDA